MYKYIFISFLFCIVFYNIAFAGVFTYSTADLGKKSRSCAMETNYYARALCITENAKNFAQKDFFKMSGVNKCSDIYLTISKAIVDSSLPTANLLSKVDEAYVQCQNAIERNIDNITKGLQKQVALMFVNGDDSDISKYDVVYELSKAEAMIVNSLNVNKKSNPIRILPNNIKLDCAINNNFLSICPQIKLKYYDKDSRKERENSILGHVIFMQKAMAEIVKYSLMVKIVPGFPFVPTIAKKNNTTFGISMQIDFVPVPISSDYRRERELKGPLDISNLTAKVDDLFGSSDADKGAKNTSDNMETAKELTNVKDCIEISTGSKIFFCFGRINANQDEDHRAMTEFAISAAVPEQNVLPQPPEKISTLLNLKELHTNVVQAIQETQQNTAKITDMFNAIDTYSDQVKDQMIKINSLIQEISEQFKSIESAFKSWCNKDTDICS